MNNISAPVETEDGTGAQGSRIAQGSVEKEYVYVDGVYAKGSVLVINYDGDEATNPKASTAATLAVYQKICVLKAATTAAGFQWVQTRGKCEALVEGTTNVAKDDFLEILNGETSFKKDATTRSTNSVAIACEAQESNSAVLADVFLLGERVIVAAS